VLVAADTDVGDRFDALVGLEQSLQGGLVFVSGVVAADDDP
jgi:hypothetical protein